MGDFKKLLVWQKAHALALRSHRAAGRIRGTQNAALRSQLTRAAQSIAANIVEGLAQHSERDFARFLGYALASAAELEHHRKGLACNSRHRVRDSFMRPDRGQEDALRPAGTSRPFGLQLVTAIALAAKGPYASGLPLAGKTPPSHEAAVSSKP